MAKRGRARGYEPHAKTNAEMGGRGIGRAARATSLTQSWPPSPATRTLGLLVDDTLRPWSVKPR